MNKKKSYTSYLVNHIIDFSWITQVGIQITLFKMYYSQNRKNDRMIQNDVISIYYLL